MDFLALWEDLYKYERVERRMIRDHSNILSLSEKSFIQNFRLSKEAFIYVLDNIKSDLKAPQRSHAVNEITKLATTLKFLAQGAYQHSVGQDRHMGLAQQTVSSCIHEVCNAIEKRLCPKHIVFSMTSEEKVAAGRSFYLASGIPGVIGVVDGTHIQLIRPSKNEHLFFNRKLKHSLNAMVICDHNMQIRAVNGRHGGSSHDSHVWNLSRERAYLKANYESGDTCTRILGDSGYPLEPWLLTPYRNAANNSDELFFNQKFTKGRSIIERVFGVLKGRFRCLLAARELHYAPEKAIQILNVCCALHNISILYNVEVPTNILMQTEEPHNNIVENIETHNISNIAKNIREQIKNCMIATRNST